MNAVFYIASAVAIIATLLVITRQHAVHALLYLIVSLLAVAVIFFVLGAPFVAALEIIIYAGAIMVLFIFVVMILNLGEKSGKQENEWLHPKTWTGPAMLTFILLAEFIYVIVQADSEPATIAVVSPRQVSIALFSQYLLGVEMAGMLLMAGVIGAYHIGREKKKHYHRFMKKEVSS